MIADATKEKSDFFQLLLFVVNYFWKVVTLIWNITVIYLNLNSILGVKDLYSVQFFSVFWLIGFRLAI